MYRAILYIVAIAMLGAGIYFGFIANEDKAGGVVVNNLSSSKIQNILDDIQELNDARTYPEPNKQFGAYPHEFVGYYNNHVIEKAYICFGDVCPHNGGYYLQYQTVSPGEECEALGGRDICGTGWVETCTGCEVLP